MQRRQEGSVRKRQSSMEGKKRVMLCPWTGSHNASMLVLARKLAAKQVRVTLLCVSKSCYEMVVPQMEGQDGIQVELLEFEEVEEDDNVAKTPTTKTVMNGLRNKSCELGPIPMPSPAHEIAFESKIKKMISDGHAPAAVISDMLLDWVCRIVRSVGLPSYILYACGATFVAFTFHLMDLQSAGIGRKPLELIPPVPGLSSVPWDDLPVFYYEHSEWKHKFDMELVYARGIFINTFDDMEAQVLEGIRSAIPAAKCLADKLYTVGPLIGDEYFDGSASKSHADQPWMKWLDTQEPASVLYISFGSWGTINEQQIVELAFGLLAAGKPCLLVLPQQVSKFLPTEFKETGNENRCIIQGWAPQKVILSHKSVGGFLTHCGWNSIMEAISLGGVPMIAWPFTGDQPTNARYLVDELKVAVDVHGDNCGLVKREEVHKVVVELLAGPQSQSFAHRAKKLYLAAKLARSEGGHLNKFVVDLGV